MKVPAIMNILALLLFVLLTSAIPFEANSTSDKPPISGAGHLHRRMEAFHPDELRHLYQEGWEYLALLYLGDKDLTTRYIQELIHQGKELRGENGHRQRDWLNRGSVQDLWTFYPCSDDKKDFSTIFVALEDILPEGGAAQEESERAHRPNLALWQPAGPNRCVKWRQDHDYTPPGKNVRIVCWIGTQVALYSTDNGNRKQPKRSFKRSTMCATAWLSSNAW